MGISVDEKHEVVITADSRGLIKTWHGRTGQELASFPTGASHCSFLQFNINCAWFLTVRLYRIDQHFETFKKQVLVVFLSSRLEQGRGPCVRWRILL